MPTQISSKITIRQASKPKKPRMPKLVKVVDDTFKWQSIKKHWGLLPTLVFIAGAGVMGGAYMGHMAVFKLDISWKPSSWGAAEAPYEQADPDEVRKLVDVTGRGKRFHGDVQGIALRREIVDHYRQIEAAKH